MAPDVAQAGAAAAFRIYLEEIGHNLTAGNATEHTHRPALQALVQTLDPSARAVNEPKRVACGAPDYIVTRNDLPVGYVEAKDVGRSLDEIERDEQLKRYRESLSNLLLTDYLEFRWYRDGEKKASARLAYRGDSGMLRRDRDGQARLPPSSVPSWRRSHRSWVSRRTLRSAWRPSRASFATSCCRP